MRKQRGMNQMSDEELLQWYKNNKTSKPTDMSEKDYELNMNKAVKLQQDKLLQNNLTSQQSAIAQQQKNAEQSASISNEKLLKYLGQKQQASGLATGQTSSDFINANNSYVANRASIANNASTQQVELLNSYNANKLQNEADAYNNEISILDKYRQRAIEEEDRKIAEEERLRDNAIQDKQLAQAEEDRQREIEQWQLEMDAYKQQMANDLEDREKAEKQQYDSDWYELADSRVQQMILNLQDEKGKLTDSQKQQILLEIGSYKNRLSDEYYQRLLDEYKTSIIGM